VCAVGPEFRQRGFFGRMFYILLFAGLQRQKYYFAWKLGINLLSYVKFFRSIILIYMYI